MEIFITWLQNHSGTKEIFLWLDITLYMSVWRFFMNLRIWMQSLVNYTVQDSQDNLGFLNFLVIFYLHLWVKHSRKNHLSKYFRDFLNLYDMNSKQFFHLKFCIKANLIWTFLKIIWKKLNFNNYYRTNNQK